MIHSDISQSEIHNATGKRNKLKYLIETQESKIVNA